MMKLFGLMPVPHRNTNGVVHLESAGFYGNMRAPGRLELTKELKIQ